MENIKSKHAVKIRDLVTVATIFTLFYSNKTWIGYLLGGVSVLFSVASIYMSQDNTRRIFILDSITKMQDQFGIDKEKFIEIYNAIETNQPDNILQEIATRVIER